jgi:hypothetical protein
MDSSKAKRRARRLPDEEGGRARHWKKESGFSQKFCDTV